MFLAKNKDNSHRYFAGDLYWLELFFSDLHCYHKKAHSFFDMSVEAFSEFLNSHPDIATKVAACSTYDEVSAIAKANGFEVTGAELTKHAAKATSELSDDQLEAVAGGSWTESPSGDAKASTAAVGSAATATSAGISATVAMSIIVK